MSPTVCMAQPRVLAFAACCGQTVDTSLLATGPLAMERESARGAARDPWPWSGSPLVERVVERVVAKHHMSR